MADRQERVRSWLLDPGRGGLAVARRGLDTSYARGAHPLPDDVTGPLAAVDEPLAGVLGAELETISG